MNLIYLCILIALFQYSAAYQRIKDYKQYLDQWKKIVPKENIHDVSKFALPKEQCYGKKCQFYYYQYADLNIKEDIRKRTILMVSGMHGNQFLGPHTLLYAYKHLKAYRILYFPLANPSGFLKNKRQTYPSNIDPNRDYPIDSNNICYQTSAALILDMLYRTYSIDFTIILHNGGTQIGFNWGTTYHKSISHTVQYLINIEIAEMMKKVGGKNNRLQQFTIGTMTQTIYPVSGTFDDWAYAASRFPAIITKCFNYQYKPYHANMTNGLVFLIQMGPKNNDQFGTEKGLDLSPLSQSKHNGHVSRTIRILKQLMHIFFPKLKFKWSENITSLQMYVKGCFNATIDNLTIQKYNNSAWLFNNFKIISKLNLQGNLRSSEPRLANIQLNALEQLKVGDRVRYKGVLKCDTHWNGIGSTFFSTERIYNISQDIEIRIQEQLLQIKDQNILNIIMPVNLQGYFILQIIIVVCLVALLVCIILKVSKTSNRKIQKFEEAQQIYIENQFGENGQGYMEGDLHTARGGIIQM